ncbi:MAG TPA: hypothetical protein VMR43_06070 [Variovorax sp.]|nr:hypothetical protein [Variovorax sp.]
MNRCPSRPRRPGPATPSSWSLPAVVLLAASALASTFAPRSAQAQAATDATSLETSGISSEAAFGGRNFPADTLRGRLRVLDAPTILLDGREDRFSPGVRIRDARNLLVVAGTVAGQDLLVNYTRDAAGLVREVWILNADEARAPRAAAARALLDFWPFTAAPAPRDDGRTPFADLPRYGQ